MDNYNYDLKSVVSFVDREQKHSLFLESGGEVVASVELLDSDEQVVWLQWLYVQPDHRGKGYAKALILFAKGFIEDEDKLAITLQVKKDNKIAIQLYEKQGFDICFDYPRSKNAWMMSWNPKGRENHGKD